MNIGCIILEELNKFNLNNWFHGSNMKFTNFKYKTGIFNDVNYISPFFLTSDIEFAKYYAGHQTQYIYHIEVLSENIMDFRELPNAYELYMFNENGDKNQYSKQKYEIGNSILEYLFDLFGDSDDIDKLYNSLLDIEYSSIEKKWVFDWLKKHNYDGAYIIETKVLNLLIFNASKLNIIDLQTI